MAESAISAAARSVADLAFREASFLCCVPNDVESLREDFNYLQTVLLGVTDEAGRDVITAGCINRITDAAYEAENIIKTADYRAKRKDRRKGVLGAISRYAHKPIDLVARHKLGKDVVRCRSKIQDIKSSREFLDAMSVDRPTRAQSSSSTPPAPGHAAYHSNEASVVGLEDDVMRIEEWLRDCSVNPQLTVISIVAMGGAGKTTLARKVYKSAAVKEHFEAFAFVSISQHFEVLRVLKEIATQALGIQRSDREFNMIVEADELEKMREGELTKLLHGFLQQKRYLIVLDDLWSSNTWEALQYAFPDSRNGCRLMLTTRDLQVANQVDKLTHVHNVRLLNKEESWQLFCLKAFPSYENIDVNKRQELESVGRNIALKCHGLPLALVILGSHLSKNLSFHTWSKMESCLDWEITGNWGLMKQIIALSYNNIPSRSMKDCFLYIASFPEGIAIDTKDLIRIWIAEGFLEYRPNQTLEDIAYCCLEELVERSMVQVVYWNDKDGRIPAVQMHNILREWAIKEAWEGNFLRVCTNIYDILARMSTYRLSLIDCFSEKISISAPNMRSILGFRLPCVTPITQRFLRVLYIMDTKMRGTSYVLGHLIHLRYIGLIRCKYAVLPPSFGKLLNLQSIDLTGTCIPWIPKSLWDIPTLRHMEIPDMEASFTPSAIRSAEQSELQTLCIGGERNRVNKVRSDSKGWSRLKNYLMCMAQLRTLILHNTTFLPADVLICIKDLCHLQCLQLSVWESMNVFPESHSLPQNLRDLSLCFLGPWNSWHADLLPTLGRLQKLVTLQLFVHQQDDMEEDQDEQLVSSPTDAFPRLRYLRLSGIQANKLRFQSGTMPNLVYLTFTMCHMTMVPDGLCELLSLKSVFLSSMKNVLPMEAQELIESNGIIVVIEDE